MPIGYMLDYKPSRTTKTSTIENKINRFFAANKALYEKLFIESDNWKNYGLCRSVTYPRIKTVITGKRVDGENYSEAAYGGNIKYFKCDWTARRPEEYLLSNALCLHIREMIELQQGIEIDNIKNVLILNKADFKKIVMDDDSFNKIEKIWVNQNLIFNTAELERLKKLGFKYIPKEFFGQELKEAAE